MGMFSDDKGSYEWSSYPAQYHEPDPRPPVYGFQTRMLWGACQHLHSYLILESLLNPKSSATSPTFMPFITNTAAMKP